MSLLRILANHEMLSLQPNDAFSDSSAATPVLKLICPGLLNLDESGEIVPSIARTWAASPDQRVFRFRIHPGLVYSDGQAADSESIAAGLRRSLDPRRNSIHARDLETVSDIRALSATELEITTSAPFASLPWYLAWRHYAVSDSELQPIGVGPYLLDRWNRGESVRLVRNPRYQIGPAPHFDEIEIRFAPTSGVRREMALSGDFDFIETLPPSLVDDPGFRKRFTVMPVNSGSRTVLAYNARTASLATAKRRASLAGLLDLAGLREKTLGVKTPKDTGGGIARVTASDIEELRHLSSRDGLRLVAPNISPVHEVARELEHQLDEHGLKLSTQLFDDPPWWHLIYPGLSEPNWDLAIQSMPARPRQQITLRREYHSLGPFNPTGVFLPELDELIELAHHSPDLDAQEELAARAMATAEQAVMYTELYRSHYAIAASKRLMGVSPHALGFWGAEKFHT